MRLSDALAGYWLEKRIILSSHTCNDYTHTYNRLCAFLGDPLFADITADDLRRFLAHVQCTYSLGRKTLCNHWVALSSLWTWAAKEHGLPHIIRGRIDQPKKRTSDDDSVDPLEPKEIALMLDAVHFMAEYTAPNGQLTRGRRPSAARDRAIMLTLLDSGLRASELCALTIKDYDKLRGRLHVRHGKGDKGRFVPLGSRSQQAIQEYLASRPKAKSTEALFSTRTGRHLNRHALGNLLEQIGRLAGVHNPHPHRWRHTYATNFLRAGGNALLLQRLLGHSSLDMTNRYVKFVEADISGAGRFSPADKILS